jgi:site-specific DNA recombinase
LARIISKSKGVDEGTYVRFGSTNRLADAVIYTRVSTDEQAETGFSLANQEDLSRRECARRGYEIVDHYRNDGYSATTFERPAFQRLFGYLKQHKKQVDLVLVTKWRSFSRNIENTILMIKEFRKFGTKVTTLDDAENSDIRPSFFFKCSV